MKFIKICRDSYIRADRILVLEVVENCGEFAIDITLDGDTRLTLEPFNTRDEAAKRLEEIVTEINKESRAMKRPIKFRRRVINRKAAVGFEADIGDIETGSLIIYEEEPARHRYWINRQEKGALHITYPVDEDSVAQLVGYDKDGREVYEGDVLIDVGNGTEWIAVLNPAVTLPKYEHLENSNLELSMLKLKEV